MKYLLIDTNSWKHLLEQDPKSELSKLLNFWISQNAVSVLIPEVIRDTEWPRIRTKHIEEVKKAHKLTLDQVDMTKSPLSGAVSHAFSEMMRRIGEIEKIIKSGLYVRFSVKVNALVMKRYSDRLPPFHIKERSNDDGLIYFSAIEYLKAKQLTELVFISNDKKSFSDEADENKLHPKLKVDGVKIDFSRNIHKALHDLKEELPKFEKNTSDTDIDYVTEFSILENPPKHILDQIHQSLQHYYDQIKFIPPDILRRMFPIKTKNKKHPYTEYAAYALGTNNPKLYELISSIQIQTNNKIVFKNPDLIKGVTHAKKKAFEIFRILNDNIVTEIFQIGGRSKDIDIELHDKRNCNCTRCSNYRLDFGSSLNQLTSKPSRGHHENMKQAHVAFQFGLFSQSMKLYYHVYKESLRDKKSIRAYICFFNLKRIKNYITGYFSKVDTDIERIVKEIEKISTISEIYRYPDQSEFSLENIFWLKDHKFFTDASTEITEKVSKIRDHYYSQLNGGWSSNSNIRLLITKFVEFERYLNQNFIVFQPSDIMEIFENALEGLFMAHAFNEEQSSRLVHFNDYLLLMMIKYAKPGTIYKLFRRYNLSTLNYVRGKKKEWEIETIALHYFENYVETLHLFKEKKEQEGYFFDQTLQRTTLTILSVCALADVKKDFPNKLVRAILDIIKTDTIFRKTDHEYFAAFLIRKSKMLDKTLVKELLETSIRNNQLHDERIFDGLNKIITKYHPDLLITNDSLFREVEVNFMQKCTKCNEIHYQDSLLDIFKLVDSKHKAKISAFFSSMIKSENDWHIYYLASIYEIIDAKKFLPIFLPLFEKPPPEKEKHPPFFHQKSEANLSRLNELINLSIKFNLPIEDIVHKFKGYSDYYDFILDPVHFDKKKFKPSWLQQYPTSLYLERIFGDRKIIEIMRKHLKKTKHPKLSEYYIEFVQ